MPRLKAVTRSALWDVFAFLLLLSSGLVMVLVLLATKLYYADFKEDWRALTLAWMVILGGVAVLASLAQSILRLYIRPAIEDGQRRRTARKARRRNA